MPKTYGAPAHRKPMRTGEIFSADYAEFQVTVNLAETPSRRDMKPPTYAQLADPNVAGAYYGQLLSSGYMPGVYVETVEESEI